MKVEMHGFKSIKSLYKKCNIASYLYIVAIFYNDNFHNRTHNIASYFALTQATKKLENLHGPLRPLILHFTINFFLS